MSKEAPPFYVPQPGDESLPAFPPVVCILQGRKLNDLELRVARVSALTRTLFGLRDEADSETLANLDAVLLDEVAALDEVMQRGISWAPRAEVSHV